MVGQSETQARDAGVWQNVTPGLWRVAQVGMARGRPGDPWTDDPEADDSWTDVPWTDVPCTDDLGKKSGAG